MADAQTLINSAVALGFDRLAERQLKEVIAYCADNITVSGGGGLVGVGSPEGAVTAAAGTSYLDTSTDSLWYKASGAGDTGWVQLIA